jgi:hypothetical protein
MKLETHMQIHRSILFAALLASGGLSAACGGGSPNAAGGEEGEAMQQEAEANGYPDVELEAYGGEATADSADGGYMDAATGTTGGNPRP